ncbi:MAG: hypothetical protein HRT80_09880 [Henriciella sp.]|nr:hypothetical protein [Henriciella sp.]
MPSQLKRKSGCSASLHSALGSKTCWSDRATYLSLIALGFCLIATSLSPGAAQAQAAQANCTKSGVYEGRVFLCGEIDEEMLAVAEANLVLKGETEVFVDSIGGSGYIASRISILLLRNKSRVWVSRRCYSACTQFLVFIDDVTVLPWTEIGFHHSVIAFDALKVEFDEARDPLDWSSIDAHSNYQRFVARLTKADPNIFAEAFDQLDVQCHERKILNRGNRLAGFEYRSTYRYWVPTRDQINQARRAPIQGWWPNSWLAAIIGTSMTKASLEPRDIVYGSSPERVGSSKRLRELCD